MDFSIELGDPAAGEKESLLSGSAGKTPIVDAHTGCCCSLRVCCVAVKMRSKVRIVAETLVR